MKKLWLYAFAAAFCIVSSAAFAQQKAPPASDEWMEYKSPYVGEQNDLSNPHRTIEEILIWARERGTEVLSFSSDVENEIMAENAKINGHDFKPEKMDDKLRRIRGYFTPEGWREYVIYVKQTRLADMVREKDYSVTTIVNGNPSVVDSGTVAGAYHWLVKLPLMITFIIRDSMGEPQPAPAADYELVMQVGRNKDTTDLAGIAIEGWKMTAKNPVAP